MICSPSMPGNLLRHSSRNSFFTMRAPPVTREHMMKLALGLAERAYGRTSPNPMVGAVLVKKSKIIGRGWHHRAGNPHAEIEALRDAATRGFNAKGADLYVTLEPCSTHGRTPPCTEAILAAGVRRVFIGSLDPNPRHHGRAPRILRRAGIQVVSNVLELECQALNRAFNHWIVHRTPLVAVKAAMTLDGRIALPSGESKWITGAKARAYAMKLREGADAILVGIKTILADDPSLTFRSPSRLPKAEESPKILRRFVLDSMARTPLNAKIVCDSFARQTTIVVSRQAPRSRVVRLRRKANVLVAPARQGRIDLRWLLQALGRAEVTSLLVEGGGEVNASFLLGGFAQRVAFFYAPKIFGGRDSLKGVAGRGITKLDQAVSLENVSWRRIGRDLLLEASVRKM